MGIMKPSLDDILFEKRNREYGSYRLRKRYVSRLLISFLISVTSVSLFVVGYFWYLNTGGDSTVFLMPSAIEGVKSVPGSLMEQKDLDAYLKGQSEPETPEPDVPELKPLDALHSFVVKEDAKPDSFIPLAEDQPEPETGTGAGEPADSAVFGGYLLGGGEGSGMGSGLDKFPEFPGGPDGVRRYIELTVKYPAMAIKKKINGVVIVSFHVNKSGGVDNIIVERGVNPLLDQEAMKAVSNMPRWKPGMRHGKPVIVKFVIPVRFMPLS
jgi:periplasmic protein TonB